MLMIIQVLIINILFLCCFCLLDKINLTNKIEFDKSEVGIR